MNQHLGANLVAQIVVAILGPEDGSPSRLEIRKGETTGPDAGASIRSSPARGDPGIPDADTHSPPIIAALGEPVKSLRCGLRRRPARSDRHRVEAGRRTGPSRRRMGRFRKNQKSGLTPTSPTSRDPDVPTSAKDVQRHELSAGRRPAVVFTTKLSRLQRRILRLLKMKRAYDT
jgi:hypothetical protein